MEMMSFKEFVYPGALLNTGVAGIDNQFFGLGRSLELPTPTLDLPTRAIEGVVTRINYTENPISVNLSDGTTWNLTKKQWDYLYSTNKLPRVNSKVQIEMFLDGTIKSVNVYEGKSNETPAPLAQQTGRIGGRLNDRRHMPF